MFLVIELRSFDRRANAQQHTVNAHKVLFETQTAVTISQFCVTSVKKVGEASCIKVVLTKTALYIRA